MKADDVRAYVDRDWSSVRRLKDRYWAERMPQLTAEQALGIAEDLRRQALALRPGWPDDRARQADLRTHARVSECLRRVSAPTRV